MADVDFGDMLDWLALDGATDAILLYIEQVRDARKFMSAARAAARAKPVIVVKAGRSAAGRRAALSHTGAMAGSDAVYDAAFRRAGMLRVADLDELFEAATTLATGKRIHGDRLAIIGNGGGLGVLATDALEESGGNLAPLQTATIERLNKVLPPGWSRGNPIDIIGDANAQRYVSALQAMKDDANIDAALVLNAPTAVASSDDTAQAVAGIAADLPFPLLTSWVGGATAAPARRHFLAAHLPSFETPRQAVRGFMHLVNFQSNRDALMQTPVSMPQEVRIDVAAARGIIDAALGEGRDLLNEPEAKLVLAACGIPVVPTATAKNPAEAGQLAAKLGGPVVLKIISRDITHKTDVGGVSLNLAPDQVENAACYMQERVHQHQPQARLEGFSVQPMVQREQAQELILGMSVDGVFGPVLLFGHGGVAVERIADSALALPPLNMALAYDTMRRTRVFRLLQGYRDHPPAALDAIAHTLIKIGQAAIELPQIVELDINPLLADDKGVLALDARIKVQAYSGDGQARLAIKPYPRQLERQIALRDGSQATLRPVRPEDEPVFQETFAQLDKEDVRMRFFAPLGKLTHVLAARLTQIDYDRQMAFVAIRRRPDGTTEGLGVVRIAIDPNHERGEYAVVVRSDLKGAGLGHLLMMAIIDYAKRQGLREIFGLVLRENERMLRMARQLGFTLHSAADDPTLVEVKLALR
jgi:acetyltransferase